MRSAIFALTAFPDLRKRGADKITFQAAQAAQAAHKAKASNTSPRSTRLQFMRSSWGRNRRGEGEEWARDVPDCSANGARERPSRPPGIPCVRRAQCRRAPSECAAPQKLEVSKSAPPAAEQAAGLTGRRGRSYARDDPTGSHGWSRGARAQPKLPRPAAAATP